MLRKKLSLSDVTGALRIVTTAATDIYVDSSTGSDGNPGSSSQPLATIQAAFDKIPYHVKHPLNVYLAAGNYAGAVLAGKTIHPPRGASANYINVQGTLITATGLATGTTSGTLTAFSAASGSTFAIFTDGAQGWTVNDLVGKILSIDSGTGATANSMYVIQANTATTITALTLTGTLGAAGSTYSIKQHGTILTSGVAANTGDIFGQTNYGINYLRVDSCQAGGNQGSALAFQRLSFTGVDSNTALYLAAPMRALFLLNKCVDVGASTVVQAEFGSTVSCIANYIDVSTGAFPFLGRSTTRQGSGFNVSRSYIKGASLALSYSGSATVTSSYFTGAGTAAIDCSNNSLLQIVNTRINGGARGIFCSNSSSGGGIGQVGCNNVDISNTTVAAVYFASSLATGEFSNTTGTGNAIAFYCNEGAHCNVAATVTCTGTVELQTDGTNTTLAAMRAATPKTTAVTNYGSVIYE